MTMTMAKAFQEKYGMDILRDPVTHQAHGLVVESNDLLPDLDKYADAVGDISERPCGVTRVAGPNGYRYTIETPASWFDLWGWADRAASGVSADTPLLGVAELEDEMEM